MRQLIILWFKGVSSLKKPSLKYIFFSHPGTSNSGNKSHALIVLISSEELFENTATIYYKLESALCTCNKTGILLTFSGVFRCLSFEQLICWLFHFFDRLEVQWASSARKAIFSLDQVHALVLPISPGAVLSLNVSVC